MAYTTINKSTAHFNTNLWLGNTSGQTISGVGFKPDLNWSKCRSNGYAHQLIDSVRGITKQLNSNDAAAEGTNANGITAFNSDGYSIGTQPEFSNNGNTFAGWSWKAGTSFSNSAGANGASIASTGSINTTAGFSIISYTGSGSNATVAHGLGVAPKMIIFKNRNDTASWRVAHDSIGWNKSLFLDNANAAQTEPTYFYSTAPTNQVFYLGTNGGANANNNNIIAYCFAEKQGYSKFGGYTGNGSSSGDGSFIYTGFKPSFLMVKRTNGAKDWHIFDTARSTSNVVKSQLEPNTSNAETTSSNWVDMLSNGFKWRIASGDGQYGDVNGDGDTYIYMAFGQSIVGSNNVPATAR